MSSAEKRPEVGQPAQDAVADAHEAALTGVDPTSPTTTWRPTPGQRLWRATRFAVGFSLPVAAIAWAVRAQVDPVIAFDEAAIRSATDITRDNPALRQVLLVWEEVFHGRWVNVAGSLVCLYVWRRHGLRTRALWGFVTLMVSWNLGNLVKEIVQRARPVVDDAVAHAPGYSFPSGHTMNATAAAVTLTLLAWPLLGRRARVVVPVAAGLFALLTGVDRVMLGAHFPSDVLAGMLFGSALAAGSYLGYLGWHHDDAKGTT